jgi:hypothetical protein
MFTWIRSWYWNRKRGIFRFWDGRKYVRVDPLLALDKLVSDPDMDLVRDFKLSEEGNMEATKRLVAGAERAFGMKGYEEGGLTITEAVSVLSEFILWMHELKKKVDSIPMPSQPSDSTSSRDESPTNGRSESGSIPNESKSVEVGS